MPAMLQKVGGRRYQALIERWGRPQMGTSGRYLTYQLKCLWHGATLPSEALAFLEGPQANSFPGGGTKNSRTGTGT